MLAELRARVGADVGAFVGSEYAQLVYVAKNVRICIPCCFKVLSNQQAAATMVSVGKSSWHSPNHKNHRTEDVERVDLLTLEHFSGCVNETFRAEINEGEIEFVLVEARPIPPPAGNLMRAPFSLLFRNTSSFLFPQQTYRMRHSQVGDVGIFLVPVAREREGFLYQAIFN